MNGADLFARSLRAQGVEWIGTLCGHGLNEVYAACLRADIKLVDVRNEQTAAYMAECWGRLSRQVGVCAVSSGVAHASAMTGVVNAHFDGAPMLLLTGAGPLSTAGLGHFQDFDQLGLAASMCKYVRVLDVAERIPEFVHQAFAAALSGRPGPVHLTFPMDVQEVEVDVELPSGPAQAPARMHAAPMDVERAVDLLQAAERPVLMAGSGAYYAGAERVLAEFAAAYAIPVMVPIWDRGAVASDMVEFMGVSGAASGGPQLLPQADLVLLLGAAADYRVGYLQAPELHPQARVIKVDVDLGRLGEKRLVELEIQADPAVVLEQLHAACDRRQMGGFKDWLAAARELGDQFQDQVIKGAVRKNGLHALDIIEALEEVLSPEAVVVVDGGNIGQWFHQTLGYRSYPGNYLTCGASGVVGYGIAGAIAARVGFPKRPVVLLSGDGAATFTLTELECAVRQQLPFVMIVADDESWGITESGHLQRYGKAMSSTLGPVDFAAVARGLGALGGRVSSKSDLVDSLCRGLEESVPTLVHVPIAGGMPGGE